MKSKWKYEIIIYWSEEDQAYIAEVPELPGCAADGKTYKQRTGVRHNNHYNIDAPRDF